MKLCPSCGNRKRNEEFSTAKSNGYCTPCMTRAEQRCRDKDPKKFAQRKREANVRYRAKYPKKERMRTFVVRMKRNGSLIPGPCEVCGSEKADAHHDNYNKPLDVRWLCRTHHKRWHRDHGPGKNAEGAADAVWQELLV